MTSLTKRLRDIREDADLKQKEVAEVLKITRQQYQLYESGKRSLPVDLLISLCCFYNLSADYVLGLTDKRKALR